MRTQHFKIKIFTSTILLFILSFVVVFSTPASAIDISTDVTWVKGYFYPYWSDNNGRSYSSGQYSYSTNGDYVSSNIQYFRTSSNTALTANSGQYVSLVGNIVISVYSQSQAVSIQANPRQYFGISASSTDCPIIDMDYDNQQYQTQGTTWLLRYTFSSVCRLNANVTNNVAMNFNLNGGSTSGTDYLRFIPQHISVWAADTSLATINTRLNEIKTQLTTIQNSLNAINGTIGTTNDKLDDLLDGMGDLKTLQQQANNDANGRYDDEKDTINNAANNAEANASSQDFNFSIPNPFQSWFGGFSDSECANIPNLAVWLHSEETRVCTPWPASVRTVMTTIVTGLCMLLLFTFIINWVKKNDTGGN